MCSPHGGMRSLSPQGLPENVVLRFHIAVVHQMILVKQTSTPRLFTPFPSPLEHVPITCNNNIPVSKIKRKKHDMKFKNCIAVESRIYIMYRCRYWKWVHHVKASYAITEMSRGCQSEDRFMISHLSLSQSPESNCPGLKTFCMGTRFKESLIITFMTVSGGFN